MIFFCFLVQAPSEDAEAGSSFGFADLYAEEDAPKRMRITLSTGPLDLQLADLKALTWEQHVHIWKVRGPCVHAGPRNACSHLAHACSHALLTGSILPHCSDLHVHACPGSQGEAVRPGQSCTASQPCILPALRSPCHSLGVTARA